LSTPSRFLFNTPSFLPLVRYPAAPVPGQGIHGSRFGPRLGSCPPFSGLRSSGGPSKRSFPPPSVFFSPSPPVQALFSSSQLICFAPVLLGRGGKSVQPFFSSFSFFHLFPIRAAVDSCFPNAPCFFFSLFTPVCPRFRGILKGHVTASPFQILWSTLPGGRYLQKGCRCRCSRFSPNDLPTFVLLCPSKGLVVHFFTESS